MDVPSSASKGKKRARPLDLQDIATAIQNLPGDSSALLPTPAPFPQSFRSAATAQSSSSFVSATTDAYTTQSAPIPPTTNAPVAARVRFTKVQQAINRAAQRANRRIRQDIGRGRYTTKQITDVLHERNMLFKDWHKLHADAPGKDKNHGYHELDRTWSGLHTTPSTYPHDLPNCAFDSNVSALVFTQSLPDVRFGDSQQPRPFMACEPGTLLSWTKYFKVFESAPGGMAHGNAESGLKMLPAQPMQPLQLRRQRLLGEKRPMAEQLQSTPPAPKRRLLSRAVTLGHPPMQNDESYDGAVHFQPLSLSGRSFSARTSPTPMMNHQDPISSPQPAAASVKFDLISSISSCLDIVLNVCTFLDLSDILTLYRVSRVFKATFDDELEGNVLRMARQFASAETVSIFPFRLFPKATIPLPIHADENGQHSRAPTLRYVNMLVSRERKVRDIVASLARAGHRLPQSTATAALKKMWLLMDIPTNQDRMNMLQDDALFSNADLLTIQMFHVKLVLYFHDPLLGPDISLPDTTDVEEEILPEPILGATGPFGFPASGDMNDVHNEASATANVEFVLWQQLELPGHALVETLLGQRGGFDILWKFLRGKVFRSFREVIELKVRYDYTPPAMDAVDHNAAQILSSMATAENAETFGHFINSIEGFADLANFDFNFDEFIDFDQGALPETAEDKNTTIDDVLRLVPAWEMGIGHLEGWGTGTQHLLRPDELAPLEAARRMRANPDEHIDLTNHVPYMGVWGNRDFTTGENLIPSLEELYISDDEEDNIIGQIDSDDDGDNDKENMGTLAVVSGYELRSVVALVNRQFENYRYPTSQRRMDDRCGNVIVDVEDWQPYLSLKSRWSTLTLQEKLDVWWENHQQRLWRQAWTQRGDNDQRASSSNNNNNNNNNNDDVNNNIDDVSYTQPSDPANDDDDDDDDADNEDGYDIGSDFDEDMMDGDTDSDQDEDEVERYQSGDGDGSPSNNSQNPAVHGTRALNTPLAPLPSSSSSPAVIPLPDTSQTLSTRHQTLVRSCIRWALKEQDEVDAALLAQADMVYEEEELQHWDAFMAAAMAAGNPIFGGAPAGSDFGTDDSDDLQNGVGDDDEDDHHPITPVPNAEDVLAPEFGSIGDVVRLVRQVNDALAAAEKARETLRSDDPDIPSMANVRLCELVKEAEDLQSQLSAVLQGEVFAIEL